MGVGLGGRVRDVRAPFVGILVAVLAVEAPVAAQSGGGVAPVPPPVGETLRLSLDDAVRTALRRSPTLEEAAALLRRAEGALDETRTHFLPQLEGGAQATAQGPIPTFRFTQPAEQPGQPARSQEISFGKSFSKQFRVGASYDLDPFGRRLDLRDSAERLLQATRGSFLAARNDLVYAVQDLYLGVLRANELVRVSRESLDAAQEQLRTAEAQLRAGVSPEFDVIRARVQVANVRQGLVSAEANYRRSLAALRRILSLDDRTNIEILPVALPPEPGEVAAEAARRVVETPPVGPGQGAGATITAVAGPLPASAESAVQEAYERRPELSQALWARRALEAQVARERKGKRPTAGLAASFLYAPDQSGLAVETKAWSLVANVTMPLWDAGLTRARVRQARADVEAAAAREKATRDAVAEEVRRAVLDLEDATERRRSAAANTLQAREALRIARVRYTAGLAQTVEVTDAQAALTQAAGNDVNAAYDYLAALANLNRSLGRYAGESPATAPK